MQVQAVTLEMADKVVQAVNIGQKTNIVLMEIRGIVVALVVQVHLEIVVAHYSALA